MGYFNASVCIQSINLTARTVSVYEEIYQVRFQDLTAASMNMTVFWDVASCSLVETDGRFRGANYQTTRRNVLEYSHLQDLS
jgi:hypothetical protein